MREGSRLDWSKRKASLDIIRIIALGLVFVIHGVENAWNINTNSMASLSTVNQILIMTLYCIGRISVMLFLFLTGYLMLNRQYDKETTWQFYKTKVVHLLIVTWIWTLIYYVFDLVIGKFGFDPIALIKNLLFIGDIQVIGTHLWYMPTIIGLYLFIPFIANALHNIDRRALITLMVLSIGYFFVGQTASSLMIATGRRGLDLFLNGFQYTWGCYATTMIIGYLVRKYWKRLQRVKTWRLWAVLGLFMSATIGLNYLMLCVIKVQYTTWYNSIFLLIAATSLFAIMLRLFDGVKNNKYIYWAATSVLGIYLIHQIFIYVFKDELHGLGLSGWFFFLAVIAFSLVLSVLTVAILRRCGKMAKTIGVIG